MCVLLALLPARLVCGFSSLRLHWHGVAVNFQFGFFGLIILAQSKYWSSVCIDGVTSCEQMRNKSEWAFSLCSMHVAAVLLLCLECCLLWYSESVVDLLLFLNINNDFDDLSKHKGGFTAGARASLTRAPDRVPPAYVALHPRRGRSVDGVSIPSLFSFSSLTR